VTGTDTRADMLAAVQAHEAARRRAMIDGDVMALDRLVADGLVYQHGTGARQGKADYLAVIEKGDVRYTDIRSADEEVYLYDDVAVIVTSLHFSLASRRGVHEARRRAVLIWARRDGSWRLEVYQGTVIPD